MTMLEEIQPIAARNAIGAALDAARSCYGEVTDARDRLNAMEAGGVYAEGYIAEQREEAARRVRQAVDSHLNGARERIESASLAVTRRLEELAAVDPDELAAAQGQISLFFGDLREDPRQLLTAYEQSFDIPADRRAIEELAARALRVLPDTPDRGVFEADWNRLKDRLENRLPSEQRQPRIALNELERAREYLADVEEAVTAAIAALVDPRRNGNLTAYSKAHIYEEDLAGESIIAASIPAATAVG